MIQHESPEIVLEKRAGYIESYALWSMIGYLNGVGDRHESNILMDKHSYQVQYIDFELVFGMGKNLAVTELVNFRVTPSVVLNYGYFGLWGHFKNFFYAYARILSQNKDYLIEALRDLEEGLEPSINNSNRNVAYDIKGNIPKYFNDFMDKIGGEFNPENVDKLLKMNSSKENLKMMFSGWNPYN